MFLQKIDIDKEVQNLFSHPAPVTEMRVGSVGCIHASYNLPSFRPFKWKRSPPISSDPSTIFARSSLQTLCLMSCSVIGLVSPDRAVLAVIPEVLIEFLSRVSRGSKRVGLQFHSEDPFDCDRKPRSPHIALRPVSRRRKAGQRVERCLGGGDSSVQEGDGVAG